ncbi:MAG TPA: AraC family transcriptional regulator [Octadecabacter sp.]|nr:AraC family transcriptional regulator [Octadecabacter sp.]
MHKPVQHHTVLRGVDAISIRSDRTFPRHSHDEFGFGYIAAGGQESWSGRGLVEASAGETITVNPAELHDGIGRKGQPRHWRMLYLSSNAVERLTDMPVERVEFSRPVDQSKQMTRLVIDAITAATLDTPEPDHVEQLVMLALDALLDAPVKCYKPSTLRHSSDVQIVLDMIQQDWATQLTLDDFSGETGASRFQVLRRFSRELGATPHAYLTQLRVKRAKAMIVAGSPLADTAYACGFSDQSHLTRAFSRQLGVTPGCFSRAANA